MRGKPKNNGLWGLIADMPENVIMAEVGCYAGESTVMFLSSGKIKKLYAIDPWSTDYDHSDDPVSGCLESTKTMRMVYDDIPLAEAMFDANVMDNNKNVVKMKMTLDEAFDDLPPLDMIYIDGDHKYQAVVNDIVLAKKIVKKGGWITGHDYNVQHPGVIKAVNELFDINKVRFYLDASWMFINE